MFTAKTKQANMPIKSAIFFVASFLMAGKVTDFSA